MEFLEKNVLEILALFISIVSLTISGIIAVKGWWKHRNIYGIERTLFFRNPEKNGSNNNEELKKKLSSGKYTILYTSDYGGSIEVILGKLKK